MIAVPNHPNDSKVNLAIYKNTETILKDIWDAINKNLKIDVQTRITHLLTFTYDTIRRPGLEILVGRSTDLGYWCAIMTMYINDNKLHAYIVHRSKRGPHWTPNDNTNMEFDLSDPNMFENATNTIRKELLDDVNTNLKYISTNVLTEILRKLHKELTQSRVEVVGNEAKTKAENET
jgi:hypothetical protein